MIRLIVLFVLLVIAGPAFAQELPSAPANTEVTWRWGEFVIDAMEVALPVISTAFVGLLTYGMTLLPLPIRLFGQRILTQQAEQMFQRAIQYGYNAVQGAVKDKELTLDLGSKVAAEAANYVVTKGSKELIDFLDGPDGILQRVFARLDLPASSTAAKVHVPPVTVAEGQGASTPQSKKLQKQIDAREK